MRKSLSIIFLLLTLISCSNSKKKKISCDAFNGKWTSEVKNSELNFTMDDGDYIFSYNLTDPKDASAGAGSSGQVCECTDKGLITEEKDQLVITDGKIKFRGQTFTRK